MQSPIRAPCCAAPHSLAASRQNLRGVSMRRERDTEEERGRGPLLSGPGEISHEAWLARIVDRHVDKNNTRNSAGIFRGHTKNRAKIGRE